MVFKEVKHLFSWFGIPLTVWLLSGCATISQSTQAVGTSQPSQIIEFYDASGRHLGYGKVQGGAVEFFNVDGSRRGFGKAGR